jgi:hypothetical protein
MSINQKLIYVNISYGEHLEAKTKYGNKLCWNATLKKWYFTNEQIINGKCNGYKVISVVNEKSKVNENVVNKLNFIGVDPFEDVFDSDDKTIPFDITTNLFDVHNESPILNDYLKRFTVTENKQGFILNYVKLTNFRFTNLTKYFQNRYDDNNNDRIKLFVMSEIKYFYKELITINEHIINEFKEIKKEAILQVALNQDVKSKYDKLIVFGYNKLIADLQTFLKKHMAKEKPYYESDTICVHCKHDKLSEEMIDEIQCKYKFKPICYDCKDSNQYNSFY